MVWSAPMTAVSGAVLTAAQWNTYVRDNLLETGPAKATQAGQIIVSSGANQVAARTPAFALVTAVEATTSTSFGDLATIGPQVTLNTGTSAFVFISSILAQSTVGSYAICGYQIDGATSISPGSSNGMNFRAAAVNQQMRLTNVDFLTSLTPGVNTFTMKYQVGTSGTASFGQRAIFVLPFS